MSDKQDDRGQSNSGGAGGDKQLKDSDYNFIKDCIEMKNLGDALVYCWLHEDKFLYVRNSGAWLIWMGHHWGIDWSCEHVNAAQEVVNTYLEFRDLYKEERSEKRKEIDDADEKETFDRITQSRIKKINSKIDMLRTPDGIKKMLAFVHTNPNRPLAIKGDELDQQKWLLTVNNGVVDLQSGELMKGRREYFMCKSANSDMDLTAKCTLWEDTVYQIMNENQALYDYVQRLFGSALPGDTTEHILPLLHGQGRNGKTLILEIIMHVLGDLAGMIQAEILLDQGRVKNSSGPSADVLALRGLRFAVASETDANQKLSPACVKRYTGGDTLVARAPHDKHETTWKPTHSLFLITNHEPKIVGGDDFALWERIHKIPFDISFVNRKPKADNERRSDPTLKQRILENERSGVLLWLIKGCLEWQKKGLNPPPVVLDATKKYRLDQDYVQQFIDDCCVIDSHSSTKFSEAYQFFTDWYTSEITDNKRYMMSKPKFGKELKKKFKSEKIGGVMRYWGFVINPTLVSS